MFRHFVLAASLVCFAVPALAAPPELEFMPGTPMTHKIAYAKNIWGHHCSAPIPNIDPSSIPGAEAYISGLTKKGIVDLIKQHCGQVSNIVAANTN